ncbi:MAG: response regulator [Planctomycetota bacterium]|nr:response regulator [Planctomycetota bacterium]
MSKRVLLCDDEIQIIRAAEFKIKRAGYDVTIAADGQEGWEMIQQQRPDIVVTDCQMPRLDGLGLVKKIRTNAETADMPVLMLTAKGYELDQEYLYETLGIAELIPKPFSPRELLKSVEQTLQNQEIADPVPV